MISSIKGDYIRMDGQCPVAHQSSVESQRRITNMIKVNRQKSIFFAHMHHH